MMKNKKKKKSHKKILAILVGAPSSGKSYYCSHTLYSYFRISRDDFKKGYYNKFLETLLSGQDLIVVDGATINISQRLRFLIPAKQFGFKITYYMFMASRHLLIKRLMERKNNLKKAEKILQYFQDNYQEPQIEEGYDEFVEVGTE